jgi:hypothetical protein
MAAKPLSFSRVGIGFGLLIQTVCIVFLVIAANYIGFNFYRHWDFSRSQKFTLADQTKQALRQFPAQSPLKIIAYYSATSLGPDGAIYGDVQNLLDELKFSARNHVQIEWVDPTRNPSRARELQTKYKFDGSGNVLILDYAGRSKFVRTLDLADYDMGGVEQGEPPRLQDFKGEAVLTAALIELLNPERAKIYFLQGHDEISPASLTRLGDFISRQNATCFAIDLAAQDSVPKDAGAVFIVGAKYDLTDRELTILENYWKQDGRMVVLLDPTVNTPKLRKLLNDVGIFPRNDRVLRIVPSLTQPGLIGIERRVVGQFLPESPITQRLAGVNAFFIGNTQSIYLDTAAATKADIQLRPLIQAAEAYWGETKYADTSKGVQYDDGEDTGQPVIIAASAEKGGVGDARMDVATSRMVVVGNCDFVTDDALADAGAQADIDFMVSTVNRMLERHKLSGIAPKSAMNVSLSLLDSQIRGIALYTLVAIPGAAALIGFIVGWRRRA